MVFAQDFFGTGISFTILGAECLIVNEAVIVQSVRSRPTEDFWATGGPSFQPASRTAARMGAVTFMSAGIVVLLYSLVDGGRAPRLPFRGRRKLGGSIGLFPSEFRLGAAESGLAAAVLR